MDSSVALGALGSGTGSAAYAGFEKSAENVLMK
jgi:hypothetical protein